MPNYILIGALPLLLQKTVEEEEQTERFTTTDQINVGKVRHTVEEGNRNKIW